MTTLVAPGHPANSWAYSEDIPGSRCGPDDGPGWPRPYVVLEEDEIWRELRFLAKPQSTQFDASRGWRVDSVNFQPSPTTKTQDRYVVKQLEINGRQWLLSGVFDGHLGDVTVDHVSKHLPIIVGEFLQHAFDNDRSRLNDPAFISDCFSRSIMAFDEAIAGDVLDLFGGIEGLSNYTDRQIRDIINHPKNYLKARLNMYGSTALVALVDDTHENLWIANLGDCQATSTTSFVPDVSLVLVSPKGTDDWDIQVLTNAHNGDNESEVERVRREHANEPECVIDKRVLGALHPFRSLGDTPFKQPPEFTRRILYNLLPGFHDTSPWEEFLVRNRTPPYISAQPDITHVSLNEIGSRSTVSNGESTSSSSSSPSLPRFLILSSDGFTDLCSTEGQQRIIADWARSVVTMQSATDDSESHIDRSNINNILPMSPITSSFSHPSMSTSPTSLPSTPGYESRNMALRLLRRALGGDDRPSVSRVLTLDMDVAWIDDTSIVVQTL
ncbi:phosphatase 2C-like domain-containing protein [Lentinula raphanica]|uniref:Phosphatase 2C-like domain-containing protein n=1 Tax=Lentinula raphanica TaxID=153919 RepID=A0AA38P4Y3_9AGAR|nr:phosphatase 2C-like domain-containing protein [Lentinula raphanica]